MERPGLPTMVVRAMFRRCAWCGGRSAFFTGWFKKSSRCQTCGLQWRRGDIGFALGAAAVAAVICMGPLIVALGIVAVATWPDFDVARLLVTLGLGAILLPILLYPTSYTLWQAVDILMRPVQAADFVAVSESDCTRVDDTTSSDSAAG